MTWTKQILLQNQRVNKLYLLGSSALTVVRVVMCAYTASDSWAIFCGLDVLGTIMSFAKSQPFCSHRYVSMGTIGDIFFLTFQLLPSLKIHMH